MLKPYMGYSREGGSQEGAFLIFAHNLSEAKKIGWPALSQIICDEYTDMAVQLLKGEHLFLDANKEKLESDIAHVIESPTCCKSCEIWGYPLDAEGLCETCADDKKADELISV